MKCPQWKFLSLFGKEQWCLLAIGLLGVASLLLGGGVLWRAHTTQPVSVVYPESPVNCESFGFAKGPELPAKVIVDVAGAVAHPGIYELSHGSRLQDAVLMAGGFQAEASKSYIHHELNLAVSLQDQQKIYIPFQGEAYATPQEAREDSETEKQTISVNGASQKQLEDLPGVGEKRAEELMSNRPYKDMQDFQKRSGWSSELLKGFEQKGIDLIL